MTDHTPMSKVSRLEVIESGARRRWSAAEKRRIVAESESGPRQISATARRHGLRPGQLFTWRRLAREGRLTGNEDTVAFAQAVIAHSPSPAVSSPSSRMEIVLADGMRIVVDKDVDADALARVIGAILRR
ncbi:MAG: IS66-like element accessory protein TnpA [Xanthobacteraceae bacterium]